MARLNITATVQLATGNRHYAEALAAQLQRDSSRNVVVVDKPDLHLEGVIVMDGNRAENLALFEMEPERFVVIARKDAALLSRIWDAGVRHVVFEDDSPSTALLAVIAAELRVPYLRGGTRQPALVADENRHLLPVFQLPVLNRPDRACRCRRNIVKLML